MADKVIQMVDTSGNAFAVKMDDQGDGTYTPVVVGPALTTGGTISGQVASAAGSATQFPDMGLTNGVFTRAHPSNGGQVVIGNAGGTVSLTNGVAYAASEADIWQVQNLNELWVIGAGTVCWHKG
jgi:hypothetical protein